MLTDDLSPLESKPKMLSNVCKSCWKRKNDKIIEYENNNQNKLKLLNLFKKHSKDFTKWSLWINGYWCKKDKITSINKINSIELKYLLGRNNKYTHIVCGIKYGCNLYNNNLCPYKLEHIISKPLIQKET